MFGGFHEVRKRVNRLLRFWGDTWKVSVNSKQEHAKDASKKKRRKEKYYSPPSLVVLKFLHVFGGPNSSKS